LFHDQPPPSALWSWKQVFRSENGQQMAVRLNRVNNHCQFAAEASALAGIIAVNTQRFSRRINEKHTEPSQFVVAIGRGRFADRVGARPRSRAN
jgi:hypothetical protein